MSERPQTVPVKGGARTSARFCAVQALYAMEMNRAPLSSVLSDTAMLMHDADAVGNEVAHVPPDTQMLADLVTGTLRHAGAIDAALEAVLPQRRRLQKLEAPLRALLRVAVYEMLFTPATPRPIILSEYSGLSKAFCGDTLPKFIAGVLSNVVLLPDAPDVL